VALSTAYGSGLGNLSASASEMRRTGAGPGGVTFSLIFEPDAKNIELGFSRWARLIKDFRPIFTDVVHLFRKHESRHFATEGQSTGQKFPGLSFNYWKWKRRNFPGRPILQLTGTLRDALVRGGGRGSFRPGAHLKMTRATLEVGLDENTKVGKYGKAHSRAEGPAYEKGDYPRPPVRYSEKVVPPRLEDVGAGGDVPLATAIAQIFQVYIVKARKEAFGDNHPFVKTYDWRKMRRGVMRLETR